MVIVIFYILKIIFLFLKIIFDINILKLK